MPATFRKLVIAIATVVAIAGTTVGSAEARWGWRGGGWDGVGAVSASQPAYSSLRLLVPTTAATTAILTVMATRLTHTAMAILLRHVRRRFACDRFPLGGGPFRPNRGCD